MRSKKDPGPVGFVAAVMACLSSTAGAEWHVDKIENQLTSRVEVIAWTDAAEPDDGITARLQVECSRDRGIGGRLVVLVFSEQISLPTRSGSASGSIKARLNID